jgi:hypothetical protein
MVFFNQPSWLCVGNVIAFISQEEVEAQGIKHLAHIYRDVGFESEFQLISYRPQAIIILTISFPLES